MSKVSTSTESNLKTARYKTSGTLVKSNQFTSRDKVMEVRTHAAHIKVKSYNSLIKNNGNSQSWYNKNTSSSSIQSELKLNKRKWQPRNEAKLYDENATEQNKSRYLSQKQQQQKRTPAYKRFREEQAGTTVTQVYESQSKITQQSSTRKKSAAYKQQRSEDITEPFDNGIIRVTIPQHSIVNPVSAVTQIIRLTEDRELSHLTKVHSFKIVNEGTKNQGYGKNKSRYSRNQSKFGNKNRMKLIRTSPYEILNESIDKSNIPHTRYSSSTNTEVGNGSNANFKRKSKLIRINQHRIKEGEIINPSSRYSTNNSTTNNLNSQSRNKNLTHKRQIQKISSAVNQSIQNVSRSEENDNLGNKTYQNILTNTSKIPAYKNTGKQIVSVLGESRKNIEGVFSKQTSITQMINNANESRKNINISSSVRKSIKNIDGNGDLGVDTIVQTKNALLKTDKTLRVTGRAIKNAPRYTRKTVSGLKKSVQAVKWSAKAITQPVKTAKYLAMTTKVALKSLLNPIVLKGILIFGLIAMILFSTVAAFSGMTSVYAALTYTSEREDLDETWKLVTTLDAQELYDFHDVEKDPKWGHIDYFHYYLNYYPNTDINKLIAFLTTKYDDFEFSEVEDIVIGIHNQLYTLSLAEWIEEKEECTTDSEGNESCVIVEYYHLDVTLDGISFDSWLGSNGQLDKSELERYETTLEIGGTTMLAELGNPFGKEEWFTSISERYGYYYNEGSHDIDFHKGINISKNAKIKSASSGIVETGSDEDGDYVSVKKTGKKPITVKYYNLNSIAVSNGQRVKKGELLGNSNGVLQISYEFDGEYYNPWFYIEGGYGVGSSQGYNPSINVPSFNPEIISSQGWAWPAQSTRITSQFGYRIHPITGESKLHAGIDIGRITDNDPIQSMGAGTVTFAGYHPTGGNMVVINHGNGVQSYYMHLDSMSVKAGETIEVSQNLGIMGNTGGSTGIHLHFEVRINGTPVDPMQLFSK